MQWLQGLGSRLRYWKDHCSGLAAPTERDTVMFYDRGVKHEAHGTDAPPPGSSLSDPFCNYLYLTRIIMGPPRATLSAVLFQQRHHSAEDLPAAEL